MVSSGAQKRIAFLEELIEILMSLIRTFKKLRLRYVDEAKRREMPDTTPTPVHFVLWENRFGALPSVEPFLRRLCHTVSRIMAIYLDSKEINIKDEGLRNQFERIESNFRRLCDELLTCLYRVNFANHEPPQSPPASPRDVIDSFRNADGTQDLCGGIADILKSVLQAESGVCNLNDFRREVFELPLFLFPAKYNRKFRAVMLGCIHTVLVHINLVGASWNHPSVDLDVKGFEAEERRLRREFLGPLAWTLDEKVQKRIEAGDTNVLRDLTEFKLRMRTDLTNYQWAVFRLSTKYLETHPDHWEPECENCLAKFPYQAVPIPGGPLVVGKVDPKKLPVGNCAEPCAAAKIVDQFEVER